MSQRQSMTHKEKKQTILCNTVNIQHPFKLLLNHVGWKFKVFIENIKASLFTVKLANVKRDLVKSHKAFIKIGCMIRTKANNPIDYRLHDCAEHRCLKKM